MQVRETPEGVLLTDVEHFSPAHTFDCGQCFRWDIQRDGSYTGVAYDRVVNVSAEGGRVEIKNTTLQDYHTIWKNYFDFSYNYDIMKQSLSQDAMLKQAIAFGWGIRILRQEPWECLLSFIISANNNIHRIRDIVRRLCELFGSVLYYNGEQYYTFPTRRQLDGVSVEDLRPLNAGFRDKYLVDAVCRFDSLNLEVIQSGPLDDARRELMRIKGVGPKVADCVLLFGAGRFDTFPVDVWVRRVMDECYGGFATNREVVEFSEKRFGAYAGFAQQYLFYYRREREGSSR